MQDKSKQYFNDIQQFCLAMMPRDLVAVLGRGTGKGAIQAGRLKQKFQLMPGSMGGFVSPSVKRCLTNILPSMLVHLEHWGYKRDLHYTVGKKPWKTLHWKSPIFTPDNWENTISFYNGSVCSIISQDRSGTSNSMSLDYLLLDEAKFLNADQLRNETFPANRGNEMFFGQCYLHHGMTITSDMPITKKASWFLSYEEQMDGDLVHTLWDVVRNISALTKLIAVHPEQSYNLTQERSKWLKLANAMRKECLMYVEASSIENIDVLGEDFIRRMKRELSPQTFETAIMNRRVRIAQDGFYNALAEEANYYTASNQSYLDNMEFDFEKLQSVDCRMDADYDDKQPIIVAFDANSNFNCVSIGQTVDNKLLVINSLFVKFDRKLTDLVDDICNYYKTSKTHVVVFYYDQTFVGTVTGVYENQLYVIIIRQFQKNGWLVYEKYIGAAMPHTDKNLLINNMLRGKRKFKPLLNKDNNVDLIISLESAQVYNSKKDKSGEKLPETEDDLLENRTDFSDAFDTLCIGVENFPVYVTSDITPITYG